MENKIQSRRAGALESAKSYAERTLRRALNWEKAAVKIEIPRGGSTSLVYLVRPADKPGVALYAIKKRRDLLTLDAALRAAAPRGAPIPKALHTDSRLTTRVFRGHFFLACSLAPGRPLRRNEEDEGILRALAASLARLHAIQEPWWGKPIKPRRDSIVRDWTEGVERIMRVLIRDSALAGYVPQLHVYFRRVLERMEEPAQFQLCHHHLAPDDMLYDDGAGAITLIDCGNLEFSRAARDLASVRWECFPDAEVSFDTLLEQYFRQIPKAAREAYEKERDFFEAFYHLRKIQRHPRDREGRLPIGLTRLLELVEKKG